MRPRVKIGCKTCGHIACVCRINGAHEDGCKFRRAAACAVGIECEHGRDVCPICDPCTCAKRVRLPYPDHRPDNTGLDDGPPLYAVRRKPAPKSAAELANIRAQAWATRRAKYGEHGHR